MPTRSDAAMETGTCAPMQVVELTPTSISISTSTSI
jgi:hypothetical protein